MGTSSSTAIRGPGDDDNTALENTAEEGIERPFVATSAPSVNHGRQKTKGRAQNTPDYHTTPIENTEGQNHDYIVQPTEVHHLPLLMEADLVAEARNLKSRVVTDVTKLSSSNGGEISIEMPGGEATHSGNNGAMHAVVCLNQNIQTGGQLEDPSQLGSHVIHEETGPKEEIISPKSLYENHIALGKGDIRVFTGAVFVLGVQEFNKLIPLNCCLSKIIQLHDEHQARNFFKESSCLSLCKIIILGQRPNEHLTWLNVTNDSDDTVMALTSYFTNLSKIRDSGDPTKSFHELIKLEDPPSSSEKVNIQPPEAAKQIHQVYCKFFDYWEKLKQSKQLQAVVPQRICFISLFNVGYTQATRDMLPFIMRYCKQALGIIFYDQEEHEQTLLKEFREKSKTDRHTVKHELLKQLCCFHQENPLVLLALGNNENPSAMNEIAGALGDETDLFQPVHAVSTTQENIADHKTDFEKSMMSKPFNNTIPIAYFLLYDRIQEKKKSFWMKKTDIEELFKQQSGLQNHTLDEFLRFFTNFGRLLYLHDVPALRSYVIVDIIGFVSKLDELYQSDESTAKYGLLKFREEEDFRVIFDFLTTLSIAAEVKSKQIETEMEGLTLDTARAYYYIPTIRKPHASIDDETRRRSYTDCDELGLLDLEEHKCIKETLQVSLVKHLLVNDKCFLIPTTSVSITAIRLFAVEKGQHYDIEFTDDGTQLKMRLRNKEDAGNVKDAFSLALKRSCPYFQKQGKESRVKLARLLSEIESKSAKEKATASISKKKMYKIAKIISEIDKTRQEELSCTLRFEKDHIERKSQEEDEDVTSAVIGMLEEFENTNTTDELIETLIQFDTNLENLLN